MNRALKEAVSHGTKEFPFAYYYMHNAHSALSVSLHWHDEIEVLFVEKGILHLSVNDISYTGRAGDVFLINPREIHGMHVRDTATLYHAFVFPLQLLIFQSRSADSNRFYLPFSEGRLLLENALPDGTMKREAGRLIRRILTLCEEKKCGYQLGIQICCAQLLYLVYSAGCFHLQKFSPFGGETATKREILAFLQNNYAEKISLHELAASFHMSEKYFSRYFKKNFQMTLTAYVNSLRLENAAGLLTHTELSVTEIALQSGFHNISYFIRAFKASYGCSPLQYRRL